MDADAPGTQPLQFDTAVPQATPGQPGVADGVTCSVCQRVLRDEYFDVNGQPVCQTCRDEIARHAVTPRGFGPFARAALFGVAAAVLGAILYYAVIAITDFEIGIVAIAIGFMVGYAVRRATRGRGGRRFQVLALVLTYWAVGLAYTPLVFQSVARQGTDAESPAATTEASTGTSTTDGAMNLPRAIGFLLAFSLALPVLTIFGSMPGGLISAAIIAFGMHQAWRMTGAPRLEITGPYRITTAPAASA